MESKLYKLALWYIEKCNVEWNKNKYTEKVKSLDRLTYWNFGKYLLIYGVDAEWRKFSRYEVLNNAIQKLAEYEDLEEQGLRLRLPYPFGTKLYYVIDDWDYGMSVNEVIFDLEFVSDVLRYPDEYYLTREEAEQALAEMQKG